MFDYKTLKQYLERRGYKQKFVAEQTGINETLLSGILNGRRKCSLDVYVKLCKVLNVPFQSFLRTKTERGDVN